MKKTRQEGSKNLNDLFQETLKNICSKENQIKEIRIDWPTHSRGITTMANQMINSGRNEFDLIEFNLTEETKKVLKLMLLYYTGNEMFCSEFEDVNGCRGSLNKGLMMMGGVGTGKSFLFRVFKEYTQNVIRCNSFQYHNCMDIVDSVNINGAKVLDFYSNNFKDGTPKPITMYLDDIASKNETVKHFGTEINVIEQLLNLRYNVFQRYGKLTHCTTNKYPAELKDIYDMRTIDRMKEMFNIIELNQKSFRK